MRERATTFCKQRARTVNRMGVNANTGREGEVVGKGNKEGVFGAE